MQKLCIAPSLIALAVASAFPLAPAVAQTSPAPEA